MGEFYRISNDIFMEKELTVIHNNGQFYLYPTTMIMCILDNLQTRFYVNLHILMKEYIEIPGLHSHYEKLHRSIMRLRGKYKNKFYEIMKNWDYYCIGVAVSDDIEHLGFTQLKDAIEEDLTEKFDRRDVKEILYLMACDGVSRNRDVRVPVSLYFSNPSKNYGHQVLHPCGGNRKVENQFQKRYSN